MINIHHPLMPRGCVFQGGCYKDEVQIFKRFSKKEYFLKFWYSFHGSSTLATQILRRRHECISCEQLSRSSSKNFVFIGASNKHLSLSNGTPSSSFRGSPFDNNQKILDTVTTPEDNHSGSRQRPCRCSQRVPEYPLTLLSSQEQLEIWRKS
ncbi:unnamed protein product [Lactuca saligna]|uniref:Uncharacterized protein n=1 Tax=Lactuca saligna TaxID=75948 RepID=A0AA35YTQ4_LACSI|nr:unnamed protein product [Lactuca saligna]